MKGASPATASELVRRSWRNWFRPRYPYPYATFRCVRCMSRSAEVRRSPRPWAPSTTPVASSPPTCGATCSCGRGSCSRNTSTMRSARSSSRRSASCRGIASRAPSARCSAQHAEAIGAALPDLTTLVELGCGSGTKLALLVERMRRARPMLVRLVDISPTALELSARTLGRSSQVSVVGHRAPYGPGLRDAVARRPAQGSMLVLFLGSNIGNFRSRRRRRRSCARCARVYGRATASCSAPIW